MEAAMSNTVVDLPTSRGEERGPATQSEPPAQHRTSAFKVMAQDVVPTIGTLLRSVGYPAVILALLFLNLSAISKMAEELPALISRIIAVEAAGFSFKAAQIDPDRVKPTLPENYPDKGLVVATIKKLAPERFERLLGIDKSDDSCLYERPNASIYRFLALDKELIELKLVEAEDAPSKVAELRANHTDTGRERRTNIGDPITCYKMKLSALGSNTKTAIVKLVGKTFEARVDLR
jgi:hypothetical protein